MSAQPKHKWTVEEYLAFERDSEIRHEFLDGEIFAMTGASENHILITANTLATLHTQLRKRPCKVYATDMRVQVSKTGLYTYPDVVVACETPQFTDETPPSLINPTVVIEVLSPTTENYDRGKKFQHYRKLASLQEYVLVAQDSPNIEHYVRQSDGKWTLFSDASELDETINLPSIGCILALADVYEKVSFESEED
jgi:Uma2 family endonuclease